MLNRKDKAIIILILLIAVSFPFIVQSQTPPGPNTLEQGEGLNFPTITATDGYFYGATNLTDRLLGNWDVALTSPTLDTGQGTNELYDMDQNVLTISDVDFNSVNATEFYLNSENVTAPLAYPIEPVDYIIWESGSTYYAKYGENSSIASSSASGSTVMQNLINTDVNGSIYLDLVEINFTGSVNVTGNGDRANPIGGWWIYGRGEFATTINQAENHHCFKLNDGAIVHLHHFGISMPSTNFVTAIMGDDDGANIKNGIMHSSLGYLAFEGGGGSSGYAIHLKNPVRFTIYGTSRAQMNGGAGGWLIEGTDASDQWGDGVINGYHQVILNNDNMVGYNFTGISGKPINMINGLGAHLYVSEWGSRTGLIALDGNYWYHSAIYLQAEGIDNFLDLDDCLNLRIMGPYVLMGSNGTLFDIQDSSDLEIGPFPSISVPNTTTVFNDNKATERHATYYHDICVTASSGSATIGTYQTETKFHNVEIDQKFSEDSELLVILNGANNVVDEHDLWAQPSIVLITGYSGQCSDIYAIRNATHIEIIKTTGTVSADRNVVYSAKISRDG